jgi:hypothetical protein
MKLKKSFLSSRRRRLEFTHLSNQDYLDIQEQRQSQAFAEGDLVLGLWGSRASWTHQNVDVVMIPNRTSKMESAQIYEEYRLFLYLGM